MIGRRPQRLAEEVREEVARMVASELKDPRLGFVTVIRVELAYDLRNARVYVGVLGSEGEHFLRISIATGDDDLAEAMGRIGEAVSDRAGFREFVTSGRRLTL